jgi:hypothetical protein
MRQTAIAVYCLDGWSRLHLHRETTRDEWLRLAAEAFDAFVLEKQRPPGRVDSAE